jgi:hypothetical protein
VFICETTPTGRPRSRPRVLPISLSIISTPASSRSAGFAMQRTAVSFALLLLLGRTNAQDAHHWQAAGCSVQRYKDRFSHHPGPPRCASGAAVAAVRCCAGGTCDSPCSSIFATGPASSNLTCVRATLQQAKRHCHRQGKQLCSRAELASNVCCHTGCTADQRYTWTRDLCEGNASCQVPWFNDAGRGCDAPGVWNSQEMQDRYVLQLLDIKRNGYFIELAANHPTSR